MPDSLHDRPTELDPLADHPSLTSLGDLLLEEVVPDEPSPEFDAWLKRQTAAGLERVIDPPSLDLRDTEPPPAISTLPSPPPEADQCDLIPGKVLAVRLERLETIAAVAKEAAEKAKDAARLVFDEVVQIKAVVSKLPCVESPVVQPVCPSRIPAE